MTTTLQLIRLELARTPEYPDGNPEHGYEFIAPVKKSGHIDAESWKEFRDLCRVSRFVGQQIEDGVLRHVGRGWRFDYNDNTTNDDEPFFKLDHHALTPGAYVSITEHDGIQRPFKVVSVTPA